MQRRCEKNRSDGAADLRCGEPHRAAGWIEKCIPRDTKLRTKSTVQVCAVVASQSAKSSKGKGENSHCREAPTRRVQVPAIMEPDSKGCKSAQELIEKGKREPGSDLRLPRPVRRRSRFLLILDRNPRKSFPCLILSANTRLPQYPIRVSTCAVPNFRREFSVPRAPPDRQNAVRATKKARPVGAEQA